MADIQEKYEENKEFFDFLLEIAKLLVNYGAPAAINLIKSLNNNVITKERIQEAGLDKKPIEFFPGLSEDS